MIGVDVDGNATVIFNSVSLLPEQVGHGMTKDNREYSIEVYNSADSPGVSIEG